MPRTPCLVPVADELPDIESALQKIDEVASNQEGIAAEEALILRGCVFSLIEHPHELSTIFFCLQVPSLNNLTHTPTR